MYHFHQEQHSYALRLAQDKDKDKDKLNSTNSWVMKTPGGEGFVKLPNERILYTSPSRTSLLVSTPNTFPGAQPFSAKSDSGVVYITNQRLVYLPSNPTPEVQSFHAPILNLQDTYVRAPFFGANYWTAVCKTVSDGGIPATHGVVELRLTFKDGGAFDFHNLFEQVKERVHQAYAVAQENGQRPSQNMDVHLEQLPAYEPAKEPERTETENILSPTPVRPGRDSGVAGVTGEEAARETRQPAPEEPPPGYEEAQAGRE